MPLSHRIEGNLDGPPIVFVHGMGVTYAIWQNLAPLLCSYYKIILVELPGNGSSPLLENSKSYYSASAEALENLRQQLDIAEWDMLGYSMGAWVVNEYLKQWQEHARRVVYLCPAHLTPPGALGLLLLDTIDRLAPSAGTWLVKGWPLQYLVRLLGFHGRRHPYAKVWSEEIRSQPVRVTKKQLRDLPSRGLAPLSGRDRPVRFLWARQDLVSGKPLQPGAAHRLVPGCHSAPMLHPAEIAEEVLGFLQG